MKDSSKLIILILILVLLIGGAYFAYDSFLKSADTKQLSVTDETEFKTQTDHNSQPQKNTAPDFTVYDHQGNIYKLSDFAGTPTVLNFWASWCGPCRNEMPAFEEKYLEHRDKINFMMVNSTDGFRETVESAEEFVKSEEFTFPVFYDTEGSAANAYNVYSLPTTYFINKDGHIVARASGTIDSATLQKGIDMIKND